jgi:predicted dehydrogenase
MSDAMTHLTRRAVLQTAAAGVACPAVLSTLARGQGPNDKLNIAGVGVGGMGFNNLRNLDSHNIVALCDIDPHYAGKALKQFPKAQRWTDYREMLAKQRDIDAVLIATPDHTHANIALAAMQAGKHVYCQKPLTQDVCEARILKEAAKHTGVVTQMGNQYHSTEGIRLCHEWISAGLIGDVQEVDAWSTLGYQPWGHAAWAPLMGHPPQTPGDPPAELAWDLWLGPAEEHPYHETYHPMRWRAWWAFGSGMMGDRGVHTLDSVAWALNLQVPSRIECVQKSESHSAMYPSKVHVRFHFPSNANRSPVIVNWYSGMKPARPSVLPKDRRLGDPQGGAVFHGSEGILMHGTYPNSPRLYPETLMKKTREVPKTLRRIQSPTHEMNWVNAIKGDDVATSPFDYGADLTELCVLGNVATRIGGTMQWDADRMTSPDRPEADRWLCRPRRAGWALDT